MELKKYEKIEIARQMLGTALSLFMEGKDYFSVLQISGACEEILGKHLKLKGVDTSLQSDAEAFILIKKRLFGIDSTVKETIDFLNKSKNSIKHMNDNNDTTVMMDPREEAEVMLERAITNWWRLDKELTPSMENFLNLMEKRFVSKSFQ